MTPPPTRTLLANLVNDVMVDTAPPAYARAMAAVTPRKLWLARPGDCIVTLAPCTPGFRDYVARTLGLDTDRVDIVAPDTVRGVHALDVVAELGATARVTAPALLAPFVADARTTRFARAAGMRLEPYDTVPDHTTLAAVRLANTKHGFRRIAAGLGLPVADGGHAGDPPALVTALVRFLAEHRAAIVKVDRSSNGHGTFVVRADGGAAPVEEQVRRQVAAHGAPRCGWTYEEFLPFTGTPSVEMAVGPSGVTEFYSCDQRSVDNAWRGMSTPAAPAPLLGTLTEAARRIGEWLHLRGYRGVFDVDCGVLDGGYVLTEANVRRTGGTYLEELVRRLRAPSAPGRPAHWHADVRRGIRRLDFAGATAALERAGLADPAAAARVVLTVDTLRTDGKWRYLVLGTDARSVADAEQELAGLLGLV